jgi:hypothetical protein
MNSHVATGSGEQMSSQQVGEAMKRSGRRVWARAAAWGAAVGLVALLTGDGGFTATPPGIDPLEILNLQVKPNVLFVIDTSSSMQLTPDTQHMVGGDDPRSRFYQAKVATRQVIKSNQGRANFGLADFHPDPSVLVLDTDGPLVYVSRDAEAADLLGRFTSTTTTFANFDEAVPAELFRSLRNNNRNFNQPYPTGCTPGTDCRYYTLSKLFRNDVRLDFDPVAGTFNTGTTPITCSTIPPPAGLLGDDTELSNSGTEQRPCFQIRNLATGRDITYYYTSATIGTDGATLCNATGIVADVAKCDADDAAHTSALLGNLQLEVPLDESQSMQVPFGIAANTNLFALPARRPDYTGTGDVKAGIRQGQGTPLGAALAYAQDYFNGTCASPACAPGVLASRPAEVVGLQKNFVILLTDGEESCGGDATDEAEALYANNSDPDDRVETLVVAFTSDISTTTANQIARAGSGAVGGIGGTRNAYTATTLEELINALNAAIGETTASGSFSTESSITESIFEYGAISGVAGVTPTDPTTRYKAFLPVLLQTSFDMPGYTGHLRSFLNASVAGDRDGPGPAGVTTAAPSDYKWDAGEKLRNRVWYGTSGSNGMGDPAVAANQYPFTALHATAGGNGETDLDATALGSALIKRRIYTAPRNGVFPYADNAVVDDDQRPIPIWPPTVSAGDYAAVAPVDDNTAGLLDTALGVDSLDLATLQSQFGMCTGTIGGVALTDPTFSAHPCNTADVLSRARRELRETILAGAAGAELVRDVNGDPARLTADATPAVRGDLMYRAKSWVLAESTLAVPAVIPVPVEARPELHTAEYVLFRDGPRDSTSVNTNTCDGGGTGTCVEQGFGLRNPDKNAGTAAVTDTAIKPVMTVVYHATNAMLHAFRGGPRACTVGACPPSGGEGGGEELWAFVPPDQLGKLRDRLLPLARDPHVYMNASSLRFSDIFVPDRDGSGFKVNNRTFLGRWRTLLFFGRGIGGKHYAAIDVTSAGPYTKAALDTVPPALVWNRGNPDTIDGTTGGTDNKDTNADDVDLGVTDKTAYATMGQSWSVPAIASVKRDKHFDKEFALFVGSGYSPGTSTEGRTFYVMDALTGDVLYTDTVDKEASTGPPAAGGVLQPNSIVANPSAYVPSQLSAGFVGNPAASQASLVYVGDLHGRLWKWITSSPSVGLRRVKDYGVDQPIANSVGLLMVGNKPHIFLETGNDNRVNVPPDTTPPFLFAGIRDDQADVNPNQDLGVELFKITLDSTIDPDLTSYRGTAQPATAFNAAGLGRVFFVGTKFSVPGCVSRFDSVVFAVGAQTGAAAYDLSSTGGDDRFVQLEERINAVRGAGGQIILDSGKIGSSPSQLPPPPAPFAGPTGGTGDVYVQSVRPNSAICR